MNVMFSLINNAKSTLGVQERYLNTSGKTLEEEMMDL